MTRVLQMPDWREGNPYQELLAEALRTQAVEAFFAPGRRRGLPLTRAMRELRPDLLHLHWPEAFLGRTGTVGDRLRLRRLPFDFRGARQIAPRVVTAHNLVPHDRQTDPLSVKVYRRILREAERVIAHSERSRGVLETEIGIPGSRIDVIAHGDLSKALPDLPNRVAARESLGLDPTRPVCLMFGAVMGYKGIAEFVDLWSKAAPEEATLLIAGKVLEDDVWTRIKSSVAGLPAGVEVLLRPGFLSDEELVAALAAADCTAFNYRSIFCSGAACLARSMGIPILLTERAATVDLEEPNPRVFRFADDPGDFGSQLEKALSIGSDFSSAADWRATTNWDRVAELTAQSYRRTVS